MFKRRQIVSTYTKKLYCILYNGILHVKLNENRKTEESATLKGNVQIVSMWPELHADMENEVFNLFEH